MVSLVTGARGFLGAYVQAALAGRGKIVAVGRPDVEIPSSTFDRLLESTRPELVVHCAGPASVAASLADPAADFDAGVVVTFELLNRLRRLRPAPRVVFISSAAIYGDPPVLPIVETETPRPMSPYGHHKLAGEHLLREFYELYDLPSVSLRVFSAYGEGLRRQVMWDVCVQALGDGDVRLQGSGAETRDFVHASDVGAAVGAVVDRAPFRAEVYNVASGVETRISELASLVVDALPVDAEISFSGVGRSGDPARWQADLRRITALGFRPSISLDDGVRAYAGWASRQLIPA
jgi:UDP-glucose 4-epimerase